MNINKQNLANDLRTFALLLESDESIIMDWNDAANLLSCILSTFNVKVTDEVYEKLHNMGWEQLRWVLTKNQIKKERVVVTDYHQITSVMPDKYKIKTN